MRQHKWLKISILLMALALVFAIGWTHGEDQMRESSSTWVEASCSKRIHAGTARNRTVEQR